jgi:HEXXH motif-containing protein
MNYFEPSSMHARECRQAMDEALWGSVLDLLANDAEGSARLHGGRPCSAAAGAAPTDLLDYAAYFDLDLAPPALVELPAEAKERATHHLLKRLSAMPSLGPLSASPRITNLSIEHYSSEQLEQMCRWWDIEPATRLAMTAVTEEQFAHASEAIAIVFGHLRDAVPELHAEIRTIVRDIVLSRSDGTSPVIYSGASSLALWGAMTINPETQAEWPQIYRHVVHEAGHNLLFAIAREQPLVADDPGARYASPVRPDPRPMDGIFHAAFVSAREAYAFDALLCRHEVADCLSKMEQRALEDLLKPSVLAFWDCAGILRAEAQLTELGRAVLADCETYMTANFAIGPAEPRSDQRSSG